MRNFDAHPLLGSAGNRHPSTLDAADALDRP